MNKLGIKFTNPRIIGEWLWKKQERWMVWRWLFGLVFSFNYFSAFLIHMNLVSFQHKNWYAI